MVIGVSPDTEKKHCRFKEKYDLPYTLIADTDHAVSLAYGVWQQKSMFGHKYMGVVRTTFVVDKEGTIKAVFPNVKVEGHADKVLAALKS